MTQDSSLPAFVVKGGPGMVVPPPPQPFTIAAELAAKEYHFNTTEILVLQLCFVELYCHSYIAAYGSYKFMFSSEFLL